MARRSFMERKTIMKLMKEKALYQLMGLEGVADVAAALKTFPMMKMRLVDDV